MPKVSIVSVTYNHEKFIRECLDGFIMQKTSFPFEVIIGDDCSTDNTQVIIKKYEAKYPDIIKPLYRDKNIGVNQNFVDVLTRAKGKYIALCEGDDYWTDPLKLQKQVDFLEANPDYSLCFHPARYHFENKDREDYNFPLTNDKDFFTFENLLKGNFIQTNSVVYRKKEYKKHPTNIMPGDWYLHLYHAQFGKIGFIDELMSVYRIHQGGIWSDSFKDLNSFWKKYGTAHLALFDELLKLFGHIPKYEAIINQNIINISNARIAQIQKTQYGVIQLFYDTGNGFNEVESIRQEVKKDSDNILTFTFDLLAIRQNRNSKLETQNSLLHPPFPIIKNFYLVPLNDSVVITIEDFFIIMNRGEKINLKDSVCSNAIVTHENNYFFDTQYPQIYFSNIPKNITKLTVKLKYNHFGKDALHSTAKQLSNDKQYFLVQNQELKAKNRELTNNLEILKKDQNIKIQSLSSELKTQNSKLATIISQNQQLSSQLTSHSSRVTELTTELQTIYSSRGWKLLTILYKIKDLVYPPNSYGKYLAIKFKYIIKRHTKL